MEENRYKTLLNKLFLLETENKLFELQTNDGIRYWDLVRNSVFTYIMSNAGIMPDMPFPTAKLTGNIRSRIKAILLTPLEWYHTLTRKHQKGTILTLNISRTWSKEKNTFVDLLFRDIHQTFGKRCFHLELYTPSKKELYRWGNRNRYYLIKLEIKKLWHKPDQNEKLKDITCFNDLLPEDFPLTELIRAELYHFRMEYDFYKKLLQRSGITHVFLQSQPKSLIAASHELGILTYDLQHGHFNDFDPYYSYDTNYNVSQLKTVTRHLLTVGYYWQQFVHPEIQTISIGNSYFYPAPHLENNDNNILIIGSRFIHDAILHELKICAESLPKEHFIYKLHSNQNNQLENTCRFFSDCPNIEIRIFDDVNTLLQNTKWLILVQSTVAYQALQMGIPVCIYKKFYFEASEDLFKRNDVVLVDSLTEFPSHFNHEIQRKRSDIDFFEPFQPQKLKNLLSRKP